MAGAQQSPTGLLRAPAGKLGGWQPNHPNPCSKTYAFTAALSLPVWTPRTAPCAGTAYSVGDCIITGCCSRTRSREPGRLRFTAVYVIPTHVHVPFNLVGLRGPRSCVLACLRAAIRSSSWSARSSWTSPHAGQFEDAFAPAADQCQRFVVAPESSSTRTSRVSTLPHHHDHPA